MVSRRGFLKTLGSGGIGAGAAYAYFETDLVDEAQRELVGPPPAKNKTHTFTEPGDYAVITKVELYESGAAVVTFSGNHNCYEKFGATAAGADIRGESYQRWEVPDGAGSTTIGLRSVLQANRPHSSRRFKVEVINKYYTEDLLVACVEGSGPKQLAFPVPQGWLRSE